jgi:hypothetical protein
MTKARKKMKQAYSSGDEKTTKKKKGDGRIRCQVCGKFNHESKDCALLQRRVMPEVEVVEVDCGEDTEKDINGDEDVDEIETATVDESRLNNEDGMEAAL